MDPQEKKEHGGLMVPALLAHLACCGGLLLFMLVGSAGFAAIAAIVRDPLVQTIALAGVAAIFVVWWRRRRSGTARELDGPRPPGTSGNVEAAGRDQ